MGRSRCASALGGSYCRAAGEASAGRLTGSTAYTCEAAWPRRFWRVLGRSAARSDEARSSGLSSERLGAQCFEFCREFTAGRVTAGLFFGDLGANALKVSLRLLQLALVAASSSSAHGSSASLSLVTRRAFSVSRLKA